MLATTFTRALPGVLQSVVDIVGGELGLADGSSPGNPEIQGTAGLSERKCPCGNKIVCWGVEGDVRRNKGA